MEGLEGLERYLRSARIIGVSTFAQQGAHPSFRVILNGAVATLAKPAHTAPEDGAAMVRYEVAGWVVAQDLGWSELVGATVLRTTDAVTGANEETSLQVLWPEFQPNIDLRNFPDEDVWKAAIFDALRAGRAAGSPRAGRARPARRRGEPSPSDGVLSLSVTRLRCRYATGGSAA